MTMMRILFCSRRLICLFLSSRWAWSELGGVYFLDFLLEECTRASLPTIFPYQPIQLFWYPEVGILEITRVLSFVLCRMLLLAYRVLFSLQ